jgi:hypothetical protein
MTSAGIERGRQSMRSFSVFDREVPISAPKRQNHGGSVTWGRSFRCLKLASIFVAAAFSCSCGWEKKLEFDQKNGHSRIEVHQPFPINEAGVRVLLVENGQTTNLFERRADTFLEFVDVYWAPDQSSVAVYACGSVELAYDLKAHKPLPFSAMRPGIAQHIRVEYQVPKSIAGPDAVLSWACFDGRDEFLKRYPRAAGR